MNFGLKAAKLGSKTLVSRRQMLLCAVTSGVGVAAAAQPARAVSASTPITTVFDVTQAPFNADQTGNQDCSPAFQAALNAISALGAGKLVVPVGNYKLLSPLTCASASLTIVGDGQASSVLVVQHSGTALTISCSSNCSSVTLRDLGFSPCPGTSAAAGTAIAMTFPSAQSGWQHCSISDVDLGVPRPGYTTFQNGIVFTNLWRGNIRNVNMHSNIGSVAGSTFVTLAGNCIDNRFNNCSVDGIGTGFLVTGYSEGLHVSDSIIIGNNGISTGSTPYSGNGSTTPYINLLGLYISNCEINCMGNALHLFYVNTAWITNSHFDSKTAASATALIFGCSKVQVSNCSFYGQFSTSNPQWDVGILIAGAGEWPSNAIAVDGCIFTNLLTGVQFGPGAFNSTARGIRMLAPGEGALVSGPIAFGTMTMRACNDVSGNGTNSGQWLTSSMATVTKDMNAQYVQ